jgi:hypothetical protein
MTIKSELLELQVASNDGMLHTESVVKWAKANPKSALHSALEWDDKKAGHAWRIVQVRKLIELNITSVNAGPTMISLSIDREAGGGYRTIKDVMATPNLRDIMLQDALDDLERMQKRYAAVESLNEVWEAASRVRSRKKAA